ncbi:MAG: choice-of-anchor V domain-containing protein [Bacteroidota bacterium]
MKKNYFFMLITLISIIASAFALKFSTRGFGDSTGAPTKTNIVTQYKGCDNVGCHTGKPLNVLSEGFVDVVSDIPLSGWVPNTVYNVTVTAIAKNRFAYGFLFTAWGKNDSASRGTLLTSNSDVQVLKSLLRNSAAVKIDSNYYATHKQTSVAHSSGNSKWTFQWQSPAVKNQEIRFFLTAVCANANGATTGDFVYRINKNADSSAISGVNQFAVGVDEMSLENEVKVYPTFVNQALHIAINKLNKFTSCQITDITGKVVLNEELKSNTQSIDVSHLKEGTYLLKVFGTDLFYTTKILKL